MPTSEFREIDIRVVQGDILSFRADVLALMCPEDDRPATGPVAELLKHFGKGLPVSLPRADEFAIFPAGGRLGVREVLLIGMPGARTLVPGSVRAFGENVLAALRKKRPGTATVCITAHDAAWGMDEEETFRAGIAGLIRALSRGAFPSRLRAITIVEADEQRAAAMRRVIADKFKRKRVFVVFGRNRALLDEMFYFLRVAGLDPIAWSEARDMTGDATPYVGDILEAAFGDAQAVVVLLTPDDEVRLATEFWRDSDAPAEHELRRQPRPNVLFEAGRAFATHPGRTVLVQVGSLKEFSDVAGRYVLHLTNEPASRTELLQRLKVAGCDVEMLGDEWRKAGNFVVNPRGSPPGG